MTSKPDEAGLPVGHAADKSDANEDDGTSHNVPNPEEAAKEARELLLADSATCQAPISHGSLQNNAQEVLLELPASRQSASPVPLEAPKQTEKCIDSTAEEQAAPSDTAAQDDPGAHEPPLPSTISEGEAIDQNDQKQLSVSFSMDMILPTIRRYFQHI